ncbi:endonuclease MutS2 [Anaerolineales bacterium HSG25]|nr:endonuclease MutS2 [Anaerolineales bacterium HSG25]
MYLNSFELPKILARLASYAMFSASKTLAQELTPTPYYTEVRTRQQETTEATLLLEVKPDLSVGGARDVRPMVIRASRSAVLLPDDLTAVRQTLISARELQRIISRLVNDYPRLADIVHRIEPCPGLIGQINNAIDDNSEVRSNASPALSRIRAEMSTVHKRLLEKLNKLVTSPRNGPYLQDLIVTQRDGRYVVPVKTEFKGKIRGVIHDQSSSGATVFVEPLSTVEQNNRWRQLQIEETDEIRRILAELSDHVASQAPAINHTVSALADLDLAFAKAKYGVAIEATEPNLVDLKTIKKTPDLTVIDLKSARHPLLDPKTVVPIEVNMPTETSMLVITGPNTGGKTVSLKTMGLLSLMAQAGLRIPVEEDSTLPVFNRVLADIGDEQSIEQSLSTFSGHMTNIVKILDESDEQSLVIFDELGAGTDPVEGSALARAILAHLLERGVTTFVATHYSELKAFAHGTPGVANASMQFDLESLSPTYRLLIGLPGASNAFTISQRLGLSVDIINRARGLIGEDAQQIEAMLTEIKAQTDTARQIRQDADQHNEELQHRLANIKEEGREILKSVRADARQEIKTARQKIRAWQEEAQAALEAAKQKAAELERQGLNSEVAQTEAEFEQADDKLEALTETIAAKESPAPKAKPKPERLQIKTIGAGDTVFIASFNATGKVVSVQQQQAEVQMGHFRTTVPLKGLELRKKANKEPKSHQPQTIRLPDVESPGMELDLRGENAEEALQKMDTYLDKAYLARLPWVTIIHGHGSGVLRQAVRQALNRHALVSTHRPGERGEGGAGVTVAKLAIS